MLKAWNKKHSQLFQSFHLECIAYYSLLNVNITDHPSGVRYVFDKARNLISTGVLDPAGYGGDVGSYLDSYVKKDAVLQRLNSAYENAVEAEKFAQHTKIADAYVKWRIIFGDYFPAYK